MLNLQFTKLGGGALTGPTGFGKPTLVVNTASECGYTPQYAELQKLWEQYRDRGLVVLGVPCNDFGAQEPSGAGAIGAFCQKNYGVTFPLTDKAVITGAARHPFYQSVVRALGEDQLPRWNFHKYLIDGKGELAGSWPPKVSPLSAEITQAIEDVL
ncbi:MAG TPA: glutathione peroxidase [Verrucomicrobiae bacterium]|nr:glutathione peroxidase [Verrucomicrobiae bacterium]